MLLIWLSKMAQFKSKENLLCAHKDSNTLFTEIHHVVMQWQQIHLDPGGWHHVLMASHVVLCCCGRP